MVSFPPLKIPPMKFLLCTLLFSGIRIPYWVRKNQTISHSCISSSSSSAQFYDYLWYGSDGHIINIQRLFPRCIQYIEWQHRLSWLCWVNGGNTSSTSSGTNCVQAFPLLGTHILGLCSIPLLDASPDTSCASSSHLSCSTCCLGDGEGVWGQDKSQWWHRGSEHRQWMSSPALSESFADSLCQWSWNNQHHWLGGELGSDQFLPSCSSHLLATAYLAFFWWGKIMGWWMESLLLGCLESWLLKWAVGGNANAAL